MIDEVLLLLPLVVDEDDELEESEDAAGGSDPGAEDGRVASLLRIEGESRTQERPP